MFGLNFIQSGFLLAGLAAVVPIIIHLLLKQRARQIDIGSVRFLQQVLKEHNRMRRLRELLLLAARVITVLLLAMLFARPFLDQTAAKAGQREVILMLDRSASTWLTRNGDAVIEKEYDALLDEIDALHEETAIRVAVFDAAGVKELDWQENAEAPTASFAATDYGKAISWARDAAQQSPRLQKEIVVFTDLQQSGMGPTQISDFPPDVKVHLRDFGSSISTNLSIERITALATEIRPKMPPRVEVAIRNGSPIPAESIKVNLKLTTPSERTLQLSQTVDLPGNSVEPIEFTIEQPEAGVYHGEATIAFKDDLAFDNRRFVAFEARYPDRILIVDGEEGHSVYGNETYFLQTALQVGSGEHHSADVPSFELERIIWENATGFPDLAGFKAIVLANVGNFSSVDANRLKDYLQQGGRVLFTCGPKFTRRTARILSEEEILPGEIEGTASLGPYRVADWDRTHPAFQPFDDPQHGDLHHIRLEQLALIKPVPNAKTLMQTSDGKPLFVESQVGAGKSMIWASTIDPAWTKWPRERLFVPLVRQWMNYLTDAHTRQDQIEDQLATETVGISFPVGRVVVANVDPRESRMNRLTPEEFRNQLNLPDKPELGDLSPEELAALAPPEDSLRPEELWYAVAWILLGWLILETFLAGQVHT